jgi:hypothetical protein
MWSNKEKFGTQTRKDTHFKLHKAMALPCRMYGSATCTLRTDKRQLEAANMRFLWYVTCYGMW